jgi:hypothetical protein
MELFWISHLYQEVSIDYQANQKSEEWGLHNKDSNDNWGVMQDKNQGEGQ